MNTSPIFLCIECEFSQRTSKDDMPPDFVCTNPESEAYLCVCPEGCDDGEYVPGARE